MQGARDSQIGRCSARIPPTSEQFNSTSDVDILTASLTTAYNDPSNAQTSGSTVFGPGENQGHSTDVVNGTASHAYWQAVSATQYQKGGDGWGPDTVDLDLGLGHPAYVGPSWGIGMFPAATSQGFASPAPGGLGDRPGAAAFAASGGTVAGVPPGAPAFVSGGVSGLAVAVAVAASSPADAVLSEWPAAVSGVWGMTWRPEMALRTPFGMGNTSGGSAGFVSLTMLGADAVFGSDLVAPVLPVTDGPWVVGYGLNGVGSGSAGGVADASLLLPVSAAASGENESREEWKGPSFIPAQCDVHIDVASRIPSPSVGKLNGISADTDAAVLGNPDAGALVEACFAAGARIVLADGTMKPIEGMERGDKVRAASHEHPEGPISIGEVIEVYHNGPRKLVEVHVDGQALRATPKHPFYVRGRGFTAAAELRPGDELRAAEGRWVSVGSVVDRAQVEPVFNIQVAGLHTYFVTDGRGTTGVLVHNASSAADAAVKWDAQVVRRILSTMMPQLSMAWQKLKVVGGANEHLYGTNWLFWLFGASLPRIEAKYVPLGPNGHLDPLLGVHENVASGKSYGDRA